MYIGLTRGATGEGHRNTGGGASVTLTVEVDKPSIAIKRSNCYNTHR